MERDPLRYVWRTAPGRHLLALLLLLLAAPLVLAGLDLIRVTVDDAIAGRAFQTGAVQPFGRLAIELPERMLEEPLVLLPGLPLARQPFAAAAVGGLLAVAVTGALLLLLVGALQAQIGARAVTRLRGSVLDGILGARSTARQEAREAAAVAGEGLGRENRFLGKAVLVPFAAGGAIVLALVYVLIIDWRLAAAAAGALITDAAVKPWRASSLRVSASSRLAEGAALRHALTDLVRRLPALRAHGTAGFERERLARDLARRQQAVRQADRKAALTGALAGLTVLLAPIAVLGAAGWIALREGLSPGQAAAAVAATALAAHALDALAAWRVSARQATPLFEEVARSLGALQARGRGEGRAELPASGALVAQGLTAYDPSSGARIGSLDLSIAMPSHAAVVGDGEARVFAGLLGGQVDPSGGRLSFGGVDLATADPASRAARIAFAGGATVLIPGTLRQNLSYGCAESPGPELDARIMDAARVAGLDSLVHARGLAGTVDGRREERLAAAIVDARRAVQAAIRAEGLGRFVDPFDPARYNRHATVGENLLFGVPLGDTFREENLPGHPFVRAILEADQLMRPLTTMGSAIASSMIEIFSGIPDGHPLFDRFSFFAASDRAYFEDLVERRAERRRGAETARDRERLIGLALRYNESRHRLGLLDEALEERITAARGSFRNLLPTSLQGAVEFYDPDRLCAAASIQDNLLFGRVAEDQAGAVGEVRAIVRRVLTDRGLDVDVLRIGLDSRVDPRGENLLPHQVAAIDLARCLVRRPVVVVAEHVLDGLTQDAADSLVRRLRQALVGRGLVLVTPAVTSGMDRPPFDAVLRFDRGGSVLEPRKAARAEPLPA